MTKKTNETIDNTIDRTPQGRLHANGEYPRTWIAKDDPLWPTMAAMYFSKKRKRLNPLRSTYAPGLGAWILDTWLPANVPNLPDDPDDAEKKAIAKLRGTPVANTAIAQGWALGLIEFFVREGRQPTDQEQQSIAAKVRRNDQIARDFSDREPISASPRPTPPNFAPIGGSGLGNAIRNLRHAMHEKANKALKS
jgi:hypothetical protein